MDSTDEEFYGSTSFITKGRRTKRQRTITTTTMTATATATTSYNENYIETSYGSSTSATPSPSSTPDENDVVSVLTTEEEETANCLILLSNGGDNRRRRRTAAAAAGSSGGGVYECKTCNRTFPSFQALGGHRTSHKKIIKPPKFDEKIDEIVNHDSIPATPPRKTAAGGNRSSVTAAAVEVVSAVAVVRAHVCGICGSEFPSGQALGGHMRRHRPAVPTVPSENHPIIIQDMSTSTGGAGVRNILPLDLNLPAPNDDHDQVIVVDSSHMVDTQFHVLPTPALLDCHY
ncbi:zinc finger protein ZAT5-like [Silene latifolia]|uniref:zinc finger protein ZAT5-like n=1 Tax=Silene latifolia TaxID=37657 RepID=UPI003D7880DB